MAKKNITLQFQYGEGPKGDGVAEAMAEFLMPDGKGTPPKKAAEAAWSAGVVFPEPSNLLELPPDLELPPPENL